MFRFDPRTGALEFRFRPDSSLKAPTEIYLPPVHYPHGCRVDVEGGEYDLDPQARTLRVRAYVGVTEAIVRVRRL